MPDNDIGDWFRSIPIISRWWFTLSIAFPLLGRIGLLHVYYMILNFQLVVYKFQVSNQPAFTCSKLTIETLEPGVKYVQN